MADISFIYGTWLLNETISKANFALNFSFVQNNEEHTYQGMETISSGEQAFYTYMNGNKAWRFVYFGSWYDEALRKIKVHDTNNASALAWLQVNAIKTSDSHEDLRTNQMIYEDCLDELADIVNAANKTTGKKTLPQIVEGARNLGGGSAPTAVMTVTENGNYDVVKYGTVIVNVPATGQAPANDMDKLIDGTITSFALPTGVTKVAAYKFYQHTSLVTLLLTGLTNIGNYAFYGCTGIKEVSIPSTLTTVGTYIFYGCTGLKTIVVNNTTLAQYQFQNTNNVDNLTLNKNIKTIPSYCFAYCGQNGSGFELVFDTAEVTLNQYCFQYSGVKKLQGLIKTSSTYAFYNCAKLESVDIESNSIRLYSYTFYNCTALKTVRIKSTYSSFYFDTYSFYGCTKVESFDMSGISYITSMPNYVFQNFAKARDTVSERMVMDFSKYTFTSVGQYSFAGTKNMSIILPTKCTTINASAFDSCEDLNLFLNSSPTLSNVSAFANNKNLKIFIDISLVDALMAKTNWTTYKDNIKGTITGVTELPTTTTGGLDVLWYVDSDFTQLVGDNPIDSAATYYCKIGPYYLTKVTGLNCSVIVSDSNDHVYNEGDAVVLGTRLDLVFQPAEGQEVPYQIKINGVAIDLTNFNNTYTGIFFEDNLSIVAIYWDGVQMPYNPTFADNDWSLIALGIKSRVGFDIGWKIGDTKTVTTTDGKTYTLRIADITADRYAYADGSGNSQAVIEFVEGLPTTMTINDSAKEGYWAGGGWAVCDMNVSKLPNFLATLPSELQEAISEVSITGYSYTSPNPRTGNSKLFLANMYEITGAANGAYSQDSTTQFQLYKEKGVAAMKKYRLGSSSSEYFWSRSPYNYTNFCVWRGTSYSNLNAGGSYGVAPVFAI